MSQERRQVVIYEENKVKVLDKLKEGNAEYMDLSSWSYQDRFFAFLLGIRFFEICGSTYPTPRKKEEVPVWFLLCCAVQMHMNATGVYSKLPGLLKNGPILSRVKFNVGGFDGGFNHKNRTARTTPIDFDSARKFFKSTQPAPQRHWYNNEVIKFFRHNRAFDKWGIFVLDQTHVVVPDNPHYTGAVRMRVDEYGHRYDTERLTEEQQKALPTHLCYALSELIHIGKNERCFVVAGYQWGPGNTDELEQGRPLVTDFVNAVGKGVMKLLIVDRGFIDGEFIDMVYTKAGSDVLIPLRKNMDLYLSAVTLVESSQWTGTWATYKTYIKDNITYCEEVAEVPAIGLWGTCTVTLHVTIMRTSASNENGYSYWGLASTFKPKNAKEPFELYGLRTEIEERHRQLKLSWNIGEFSSPHESLVEAHVLFTLLTYTLVQLHLVKKDMVDLTNKTIETLKAEERTGTNSVIVYHGGYFAVFDLNEYTYVVADLAPHARERLKKWIERQKKMFPSTG